MNGELILNKALVALHRINEKGDPATSGVINGQIILSNQRFVFIKRKSSFRHRRRRIDFSGDLDGNLSSIEGSFAVPLSQIEHACYVEKRLAMIKLPFLMVKYVDGHLNYFSIYEPHREEATASFSDAINRMIAAKADK